MVDSTQSQPRGARADDAKERSGPNEGEGSQTGAREYNEATKRFVDSGKVEPAAKQAERAVDGPEGDALRKAEAEGRRHSHGEDPQLNRKSTR